MTDAAFSRVCAWCRGLLAAAWLLGTATQAGAAERLVFTSVTPSGPAEFLAGTAPATEIHGSLAFPEGTGAGRLPAIILSHGSGGILPGREEAWAARLRRLGFATFILDSFTPRGIASTGADQSRLPLAASVADALHALRVLAAHPRIDPARIGIMGFSKGGQVALYTLLEPFRRAALGQGGPRFALHVALYASCSIPYLGEPVSNAPVLMLLGGADDYTPAAHCARYAEWLRARGAQVRMLVLEGAHHGFDTPDAPRFLPRVQSARDCGLDISLEPIEARLWHDGRVLAGEAIGAHLRGCMRRGGTFGGDPAALARAIREVEVAARQMRGG